MPFWHLSAAPPDGQSLDLHRQILSLKGTVFFGQMTMSLYLLMDFLGGLMRQKLDDGSELKGDGGYKREGLSCRRYHLGKVRELGL